jgi:hypothetical protein
MQSMFTVPWKNFMYLFKYSSPRNMFPRICTGINETFNYATVCDGTFYRNELHGGLAAHPAEVWKAPGLTCGGTRRKWEVSGTAQQYSPGSRSSCIYWTADWVGLQRPSGCGSLPPGIEAPFWDNLANRLVTTVHSIIRETRRQCRTDGTFPLISAHQFLYMHTFITIQ